MAWYDAGIDIIVRFIPMSQSARSTIKLSQGRCYTWTRKGKRGGGVALIGGLENFGNEMIKSYTDYEVNTYIQLTSLWAKEHPDPQRRLLKVHCTKSMRSSC